MNVAESSEDYASKVYAELLANGIRAENDNRNEKISYKIREAVKQKIPYMLIIGDKEKVDGTVTVRMRGNVQETMSVEAFIQKIKTEIANKQRV
jgi:threonyl-tRNA synthetase